MRNYEKHLLNLQKFIVEKGVDKNAQISVNCCKSNHSQRCGGIYEMLRLLNQSQKCD